MPVEQSDALILRIYPWSETSLIANIYTREFGKLSVLAKGARRPKGPFEAALDLLSICRVVFISKASDALDILTEAKLQKRFRAGSSDLLRLYAGYYLAELLDRGLDKGAQQPEIYDLAVATLAALDEPAVDVRAAVLRLELQLLRLTGHQPSLSNCAHCGGQLEPSGWVLFGLTSGGVVCRACRNGATQVVRIPTQIRDLLDEFSQPNWQTLDLTQQLTDSNAALRSVIQKYLTVQLDRELLLHRYLEELGR